MTQGAQPERKRKAAQQEGSYHIDVSESLHSLELRIHLDVCFDHIGGLSDEGGHHTGQNPTAEVSHRSCRRAADL